MPGRSSACRAGRHEDYDLGWPWAPDIGCGGTARDDDGMGHRVNHPCKCGCHTNDRIVRLRAEASAVKAAYDAGLGDAMDKATGDYEPRRRK